MSINIYSYNYVSELNTQIQSITKNFSSNPQKLKFVVPSRKDKTWFPFNSFNLWTWNDIYDDVCNFSGSKLKKVLSPPDHFLILDSILKECFANYPEKIQALPGVTRPGFLEVISSDLRELMNEAVPPSSLNHDTESSNPSEFLLPEVYENYLQYLYNYDLIDSSQICTETLNVIKNNLSWGKDFIVIFTGFMSFNHSQLELVQALQDRCSEIVILKPEANLKNFHDANIQFLGTNADVKKFSGKIIEIPVAEPSFEAEVTARNLALWSQNLFDEKFTSFDDVGIVISNGTEAAFSEAFERYKIPYDFVEGIKINRTLPGKVLISIRNLRSRNFPAYETSMLLTQSCFAGINFPVMKAYRSGHSGLENWEEFLAVLLEKSEDEITKKALLSIRAIKKFCETLAKKNTPRNIIKAFHEFLTTEGLWLESENKIYDFPELDENLRLTASAIQTVGEKVLALDEFLPDLGSVKDKKFSGDEAFDLLESWCKNSYTRAPVQISNAVRIFIERSPVLSHFPIWIMTDVTQKSWSANINSSPLLGNSEREKLAENKTFLPMTAEKAAQKEALFRRMIFTGEKLTIISRPELDSEGRPLSESTFMLNFIEDMKEWQCEKIKPEGIKILLGNDNFIFPEIDPHEKIFREVPKISMKANFVGASDIKELLGCSFLWWQRRHAKLYEQELNIVSDFEWGNMLHKFWECVWKRYKLKMNSEGKIFIDIAKDEWEKLLKAEDDEYKNFAKLVKDFRLARRLGGIKFRVHRLMLIQAAIIDKLQYEGYEYEKILLEEEAHLRDEIENIKFFGQCDRIEILRNPRHERVAFIIDYKTGNGENYEKSMKIDNYEWNNFDESERLGEFSHGLQLSVYAAMFDKKYGSDIKLSGVYILGLEDGKISGSFSGIELKIFDEHKSEKFNGKILERIEEGNYAMKCAANILNAGEFVPEYQSDLCKFCNVKSICRKGEFKGEVLTSEEAE